MKKLICVIVLVLLISGVSVAQTLRDTVGFYHGIYSRVELNNLPANSSLDGRKVGFSMTDLWISVPPIQFGKKTTLFSQFSSWG